MPYEKPTRLWWWVGLLALIVVLIGVRLIGVGSAADAPTPLNGIWLIVAVMVGFGGALLFLYEIVIAVMGLKRKDTATVAAINAAVPGALVVFAAPTPESKSALSTLRKDLPLEWAAALAVNTTGVSLWQSSRDGNSARILDFKWIDVTKLGLGMTALRGRKTPTLQFVFDTPSGQVVALSLIVRREFGSGIGLGHGRRIEAIAARVEGLWLSGESCMSSQIGAFTSRLSHLWITLWK